MSEEGYGPETMKKWKIWAAVQVGLVCFFELVFWGHGLTEVLGALAFSIITIFLGVLLSAGLINRFLFGLLLDRPIEWGTLIAFGIVLFPVTGAVLLLFFMSVYKFLTGDYTEDTDTPILSAVWATVPLYCRVSYEGYKEAKSIEDKE